MKIRTIVGAGLMAAGLIGMLKETPMVKRAIRDFKEGFNEGISKTQAVKTVAANVVKQPLTTDEVTAIMHEVVSTWSPLIVQELGLDSIDINIVDSFESVRMSTNAGFLLGGKVLGNTKNNVSLMSDGTYTTTCDGIDLYVDGFMHLEFVDRNAAYQRILWTLAHELRHAYQCVNNLMLGNQKHTIFQFIGSISFELPYRQQWCEVDANKWAYWFIQKHLYKKVSIYTEVPTDYETEDYDLRFETHNRTINQLKEVN